MTRRAPVYQIQGPALVSFSGGRSSGYMLKHVLDAHGGALPPDLLVAFANTGKERPETLEFVAECAERWAVKIHWLEYCPDGFKVVTFQTAARDGEPFEALIRSRSYLPNPGAAFCSTELKTRVIKAFLRSLRWEHWDMVLGLRADEGARIAKLRMRAEQAKERWEYQAPMVAAGVTAPQVIAWWKQQDFDLRLPSVGNRTPAGNCDLCWKKGRGILVELLREHPEWGAWWERMESLALTSKPSGAVFRMDRPRYADLRRLAMDQGVLFEHDADGVECFCGD